MQMSIHVVTNEKILFTHILELYTLRPVSSFQEAVIIGESGKFTLVSYLY